MTASLESSGDTSAAERAEREAEGLRQLFLDKHDEHLRREEELIRTLRERDGEIEALRAQVGAIQGQLDSLKSTRVWRIAGRWWRLKGVIGR